MDDKPIKVLLIEDNPGDARLIQEMLDDAGATSSSVFVFELAYADQLSRGLERLAEGGIDLVLLDLSLPDSHGLETFTKAHSQAPGVPMIVLTGTDDEALATKAVREGAQDYMVKGQLDGNLLARSIRYAIERHRMRMELDQNRLDLQSSEARLRNIIEKNADGIIILDADGIVHFVNPAAEILFGRKAEELLGELFGFPLVVGTRMEIDIIRKSGEKAVAEMRVVETNWEGESAYLASLRDITERVRMEEALAQERDLFHTLMDNIPDVIFFKDTASRFTRINRAYARFIGINDTKEAIGKTSLDFFPKELVDPNHTDEQKIFRSGQPLVNLVGRPIEHAGNRVWFSTTKVPLKDSQGKIVGLVGIGREITERKKAEEELKARNDEIKEMSQQLWQMEKLATMGELAASIAHELNNPMATVSLRVESLLMQLAQDETKTKALEIISGEVERMSNLVANLLQFSRRGHQQISTVDVCEEIESTLELIHYHLRNHNINVVREFAPDVPMVQADRQQLRQMFLNLITNASDAMTEGGTLTIRFGEKESGEGKLSRCQEVC